MTHKAVRYSDHSAKRLKTRGISRADVRWIIANGIRVRAETRGGEQRWKVSAKIGKRELYVVYIERSNDLLVVTVAEQD
jgi:uncharacterized DUF497 family protein